MILNYSWKIGTSKFPLASPRIVTIMIFLLVSGLDVLESTQTSTVWWRKLKDRNPGHGNSNPHLRRIMLHGNKQSKQLWVVLPLRIILRTNLMLREINERRSSVIFSMLSFSCRGEDSLSVRFLNELVTSTMEFFWEFLNFWANTIDLLPTMWSEYEMHKRTTYAFRYIAFHIKVKMNLLRCAHCSSKKISFMK